MIIKKKFKQADIMKIVSKVIDLIKSEGIEDPELIALIGYMVDRQGYSEEKLDYIQRNAFASED